MVQGVTIQDNHILDTNPSTGELIARVPCSSSEEITSAIAAARRAQPSWEATPLHERVKMLKAACSKLKLIEKELAEMITQEMGKIFEESEEEVSGAIDKDNYLSLVEKANEPQQVDNGDNVPAVIVRDAIGIVGVLSPWNFPADEILLLALPALAAGNTVIIKPSEVVPLVGKMVAENFMNCLPNGVVGLLQGDGAVGAALVSGAIDMVAMTGSTNTGKKILSECSKGLKRVVLELGGKDPMVVFEDADIKLSASDAVTWSLYNCGQVCCAVERIYVAESIKSEFEKAVVGIIENWKVGDGFDKTSKLGPMVSELQKTIVDAQVKDALKNGATLLYESKVPKGSNYYPTTVLSDLTQQMSISKNETFGPVVAISSFDGSEEEAVRLSNESQYGLSASVYSKDTAKAIRVASKIKAGQVGINSWALAIAPPECPWVGQKGSGFGYHSGMDGWRQFSVPKSIISSELRPVSAL